MSAYDLIAPTFDRHRTLPDGVAEAIRATVLDTVGISSPRLLDLGAGTGRIGWPFVAADDDYVGVDLSFGMLRAFIERAAHDGRSPRLVQAGGQHLPFRDATFDTVMLIQVFGGMPGWRPLLAEARRVLRRTGVLMVGRTRAPPDGIDERMKQHLAVILDGMGVQRDGMNPRGDALRALEEAASATRIDAARWNAERIPRGFLERHATGARFSALPQAVRDEALRKLGAWAVATFGSLDSVFSEPHAFELRVFRFQEGVGH
jgi:ubiquinone/menaquinone biosynthesis C-methylase UbiE